MFCTNCGRKLPDDISFCPFCGTKVHTPEDPAAKEPVIEEPAVEETPVCEEPVIEDPTVETIETVAEPVVEAAAETVEEAAEAIAEPAAEVAETVAEPAVEAAAEPAVTDPIAAAAEAVIGTDAPAPDPIAAAAAAVIGADVPAADAAVETVEAAAETVVEVVAETVEEAAETIAEPAAEAAEDAASAVSPDGPASIPSEEPPRKKNKGLIAAIIAVVIVALGVAGYFIYQSLPSTKLAKLRTQIASSIESKDYKTAISQIEQAYEFAPEDEDLRQQYVDCSLPILTDLFTNKDYEGFIADADKLIKDYPQAAEALEPMISDSYKALANDAINTNDIPTMQAMKDRLTDLTASGRFNFSDTINWIEDNIQHVKLTDLFQTLADKLIPLIKSGDRAAVFETVRNEFISAAGSARMLAPDKATVEYHFPLYSDPDETGKQLGIYYWSGHFSFYYGNYNGNSREGNAVWFCADNMKTDTAYREYWSEGNWSGSKPNGTFTISNLSKYANADKEQLVEGTVEVKDGLYHGKVVLSYDGSVPMTGNFNNGIADVIMTTDPNGNQANVILISDDGQFWVSRANLNDPQGIYGFD